jgi:hypothetical protein
MSTNILIPLFEKAHGWYSIRKNAPLPAPTGMINPDSVEEIDPYSDQAFDLFYTKSECHSKLNNGGASLAGISTHMVPLFAGIHEQMSTEQLAVIIEHHGITVEDFEEIRLARQGMERLFLDCGGYSVDFMDAKIAAWKAFDQLGMINALDRPNASESSHYCAMHTQCETAWPISIVEELAKSLLKEEGDKLMAGESIFGSWHLKKNSNFPDEDPLKFLRRSGMLSPVAYRKQTAFHTLWEDLCIQADDVSGHLGLKLLLACKEASLEEQRLIKDALRSMHPERRRLFRPSDMTEMHGVFEMLKPWLAGTQMDVSDSLILKLNLSICQDGVNAQKAHIKQYSNLYPEVTQAPQSVLSAICREILTLRPDQISYAQLAVFNTVKGLDLGKQVIEGFKPEDVILHLDAGLRDFLGERTKTNDMTAKMFNGLSNAFSMLGAEHTWDYGALQKLSELSVLALVRGGGSMRQLPDMGRTKRGIFLEDELGL